MPSPQSIRKPLVIADGDSPKASFNKLTTHPLVFSRISTVIASPSRFLYRWNVGIFDFVMQPLIAVPAIAALLYRAWSHRSLTPAGIVVAGLTAVIHAIHPWSIFFVLLGIFFLAGTAVTKVSSWALLSDRIQSTDIKRFVRSSMK